MFEIGFLGTRAPFYMDIVTLYFALLPFLLLASILFAVFNRIKLHYISQMIIYSTTLVMTLVFEIGVRIDGGYLKYLELSNISKPFMHTFLAIHIFIAVISVIAWSILLVNSYRSHKSNTFKAKNHKKHAKIVTAGLVITSIMGVWIYDMLFIV